MFAVSHIDKSIEFILSLVKIIFENVQPHLNDPPPPKSGRKKSAVYEMKSEFQIR